MQSKKGAKASKLYSRQVYLSDGRRTTIRLGAISRAAAAEIDRHIDNLIIARKYGTRIDDATQQWLRTTDSSLVEKLNRVGLCDLVHNNPTVAEFADGFVDAKRKLGKVSDGTLFLCEQVRDQLKEYFPAHKLMTQVTGADAIDHWAWMITKKKLGENTAKRRMGRVREIFRLAVDRGVINRNPFVIDSLPVSVGAGKKDYVPAEAIVSVIEQCTTTEWKLLFAFGRFVGCRMPSEIANLTWNDVNREANTIRLLSPKTRNKGKSERMVPIFESVEPLLQKQYDEAGEGEKYVFPKLRSHSNLATTAAKYVQAAGLAVWPKFWNSLRASCETDLMDVYGLRKACAWIGNTPAVAMKHYALIKKSDFLDGGESDAKSDAAHTRIAAHRSATASKNAEKPRKTKVLATPHGFEP